MGLNQPLTYTVTVTNNGPLTTTAVTVTDVLLPNVTFVSAPPSQGTCSGANTLSCSLEILANGATAMVTIVVTSTTAGGVSTTAQVSGAEPDPNTANNAAIATTTIISTDADGGSLAGNIKFRTQRNLRIVFLFYDGGISACCHRSTSHIGWL